MNEELQRLMDEYRAADKAYRADRGVEGFLQWMKAHDDLLAFIVANPPALGPYPEAE